MPKRGKQSGPLNDDIDVPVAIVHSTSWSKSHSIFFGQPHFEVVREIAKGVNARNKPAWFMTCRMYACLRILDMANRKLVGTSHPSPTDAPLIEPMLLSWTTGCSMDVYGAMMQYVLVSQQLIDFVKTGKKGYILAEPVMNENYTLGSWTNSTDRCVHDDIARHWQIHVAPA